VNHILGGAKENGVKWVETPSGAKPRDAIPDFLSKVLEDVGNLRILPRICATCANGPANMRQTEQVQHRLGKTVRGLLSIARDPLILSPT
jgi:hypothetical protein